MVLGGVYEQFRGALLGLLWGLERQSPPLVAQYLQQWQSASPAQGDWYAALPHLLAAWQQPLMAVPPELDSIQTLLNEYLERAWQPQPLAKPVHSLAVAADAVTRVKYALAIAPQDLLLAQQLVQEPESLPLLGCLFGAYRGSLALPLAAMEHWSATLALVLDGIMQQWSGGLQPGRAVAPAGKLRSRRGNWQ